MFSPMKVGILTFHCAHNYGAVLQAYALQEKIKEMGHKVEIIDYRPYYLEQPYKLLQFELIISKNYKAFFSSILTLPIRILRRHNFNQFIKRRYVLSGNRIIDYNSIPKDFDFYFLGSDQIWNIRLTNGFDKAYWGFFDVKKDAKKISYAPSMEKVTLSTAEQNMCKKALMNFDSISVRESNLELMLQPFTMKNIETVLDPTLLLSDNKWNSICVKPKIDNKYVLVYDIRSNEKTLLLAHKIAKQIGGVVVELNAWINWRLKKYRIQTASPEEFLGWIKYADFVVSTSFHCVAFSVIFKKSFYTFDLNDGSDSRIKSLLSNVHLSDRILSKDIVDIVEIDYKRIDNYLERLRLSSHDYIINAMQNV